MDSRELAVIVENAVRRAVIYSTTHITEKVYEALKKMRDDHKDNPIIHSQLDLMIKNAEYGARNIIPICQDTGLVNFFLQIGRDFPTSLDFKGIFGKVLFELTERAILRPNTVDPVTQKNEMHNNGENMPPIYIDLKNEGNDLIITVLNKGGGSENISQLFMLSPATGFEDLKEKILERLKRGGGKPCPPVIIGIGLGGDAVKAMYLAKKALLRPLNSRNPDKEVAALEEELLERSNALNIGVMGLGEGDYCLDVRIERAMRHPASYPVGMIVQCYSHRTLSVRITSEGDVSYGLLDDRYNFREEPSISKYIKEEL